MASRIASMVKSGGGLVAGLMLAVTIGWAPTSADAAEITGDSRSDSPILPSDKQLDSLPTQQVQDVLNNLGVGDRINPKKRRDKKRIIKKIEIIRVEPQNGNNPFNTEDPIDNATVNGLVQQFAVDDEENNNNNNDDGNNNNNNNGLDADNLNPCIGQTVQGVLQFGNLVVTMDVDPDTLDCTIEARSLQNGDFLGFTLIPGGFVGDQILAIGPDLGNQVWFPRNFAAPVIRQGANGSELFTLNLATATGLEVQAVVQVTVVDNTSITVNVQNMTLISEGTL